MAPLLSLESFRRILGWNPFHFWGLANADVPVASRCNSVLRQYNWQDADGAGRDEIIQAIARAEDKLRAQLGFSVGARWTTADFLQWPGGFQSDTMPWYAQAVALPGEGFLASFGVETHTVIQAGAAVVYSDEDGDGLDDTYTITAATTVTDPAEIRLFVPAADQATARTLHGENWRVIPSQITIAAGTVTIIGPAWTLVTPMLYEGIANASPGIDPGVGANFLATLDVVKAVSGGTQGTAYYDFAPYPGWCCTTSGADPAAVRSTDLRVGVADARHGVINPVVSVYNASTSAWQAAALCGQCRPPDRLAVNVYAGWPLAANGDLDSYWQPIVARLAMAEIQGEPCGCESANRVWAYWQQDVSRTSGADQFAFKEAALNNPFGVKRGHIEAWQAVLRHRHIQSIRL